MSGHYPQTEEEWNEVLAHLKREGWLEIDVYAGDEPLTDELRAKLGYPLTLEEAMARMQENKRKQEEAERKPSRKRKSA